MKYEPKPFQHLIGEAPKPEEYYEDGYDAENEAKKNSWYYDGTEEDSAQLDGFYTGTEKSSAKLDGYYDGTEESSIKLDGYYDGTEESSIKLDGYYDGTEKGGTKLDGYYNGTEISSTKRDGYYGRSGSGSGISPSRPSSDDGSGFQLAKAKPEGALKGWIVGGIVLLAIVMTIVFGLMKSMLCIVSIGLVFTTIGSFAVISRKNKPDIFMMMVFPLVGISMMIFGLLVTFGSEQFLDGMSDKVLYLVSFLLFACGFLAFCTFVATGSYQKRVFTEMITTPCVALLREKSGSGTNRTSTYCPIYTIRYRGKVFNLQEDMFSNIGVPKIGDPVELMINPDNPYEFCRKRGGQKNIFLAFAVIAILMAVVILMSAMNQ